MSEYSNSDTGSSTAAGGGETDFCEEGYVKIGYEVETQCGTFFVEDGAGADTGSSWEGAS